MSRNQESAIDRLDRCQDKVAALADMKFGDLSYKGEQGIVFLLRDLSCELGEVFDELHDELNKQK